jgi:hypothetical protein
MGCTRQARPLLFFSAILSSIGFGGNYKTISDSILQATTNEHQSRRDLITVLEERANHAKRRETFKRRNPNDESMTKPKMGEVIR